MCAEGREVEKKEVFTTISMIFNLIDMLKMIEDDVILLFELFEGLFVIFSYFFDRL